MLRIFTGPAGSDLSRQLVSDMVRASIEDKKRKFIIIVPEQFTLRTQQKVVELHPQHACMNIDVVSFDRLAHVVLAKLGRDTENILDDTGKTLILRSVLENVRDDLIVYQSKARQAGFIEETKSLITEFKQYGIDDNDLYMMQAGISEDGSLLSSKLQDIRLIYRRFNEDIADRYTTAEEVLDVFAKAIPDSEFLRGSSIYLDGFTGFTPVQYRTIGLFLNTADVTCSLTAPEDGIRRDCPDYDLFALPSQTFFRLQDISAEQGSPSEVIRIPADHAAPVSVKTVACAGLRDEVSYTAGEILRLVREEGLRFRDIAVLTSDMEGYHDAVSEVFGQAGISFFTDYKQKFSGNLLVRFILAALEISTRGLSPENVFSFLKTGLCGADPDEIAILENYCLEFNIKGRSKWESEFSANRTLRSGGNAWDLEVLNDIRRRIIPPVLNFYGRTSSPHKVRLMCLSLKNLLAEYDIKARIEQMTQDFRDEGELTPALQYEQIYDKLTELIEKIADLLGDETMPAAELAGMIESAAGELKIGTIPPSIDTLVVGDLTRTRLEDISYLFVLGMNDGKVPSAVSGSSLFTQKERARIRADFEIAPTVLENLYVQRYYLYLAFNKPHAGLYLTYAVASAQGEQLSPSCFLEDIGGLIPDMAENSRLVHDPQEGILWRGRALDKLAAELGSLAKGEEPDDDSVLRYFAQAEPDILRFIAGGAAYTNKKSALDSQVALDLYGEVLHGSVSRYETYYMCPYRHFLNYGLKIEKRREYEIEAADLGTIYHDALEKYSGRISREGFSFRDISDEDSHRIIEECVSEAIEGIGNDILDSSMRNEHFKQRIAQITSRTTDVLRAHVKAGLFEPDKFEYSFSSRVSDNVVFSGKIDRVDIYDAGDIFVKIIDYKSGAKKFSIRDIYSGLQLQLAAYMNSALENAAAENPGKQVHPGGIYYYLVNDKYVKPDETEDKNRMSGLTLADDDVIRAIDGEMGSEKGGSSHIIPVAYGKSGLLSRSITAGRAEFDNLLEFVNTKIIRAGEEIREGNIELAPYRENDRHTGCSYCDYKDICRFEAGSFGTDWRECDADDEEIMEKIYGRI